MSFFSRLNIVLSLFLVLAFSGCKDSEIKHLHILSAKAGDSVLYMVAGDTLVSKDMNGEIEFGKVDSAVNIAVIRENHSYKFSNIPADFLNQDCTVEFSTNEFKDYFPKEWALLKDAGNFATLRVYVESGYFHLIVINSLNGNEIARHAEKF